MEKEKQIVWALQEVEAFHPNHTIAIFDNKETAENILEYQKKQNTIMDYELVEFNLNTL